MPCLLVNLRDPGLLVSYKLQSSSRITTRVNQHTLSPVYWHTRALQSEQEKEQMIQSTHPSSHHQVSYDSDWTTYHSDWTTQGQ